MVQIKHSCFFSCLISILNIAAEFSNLHYSDLRKLGPLLLLHGPRLYLERHLLIVQLLQPVRFLLLVL